MKFLRSAIISSIAAGALQVSGVANATPTFGDGLVRFEAENVENIYRLTSNCSTAYPCLDNASLPAGAPTPPAGYSYPDPNTGTANILAGDIFAGFIQFTKVVSSAGTWDDTAGDYFVAYFASEVATVDLTTANGGAGDPWDGTNTTLDHLTFTSPTSDPFGILGAGEIMKAYVNVDDVDFTDPIATTLSDVTTTGDLWASFGAGAVGASGAIDQDGFLYSHVTLGQTSTNFSGNAWVAFNFVTDNTGMLWNTINDFVQEDEVGGVSIFPPATGLCANPDPVSGLPVTCTPFIQTFDLGLNQSGWLAGSTLEPYAFRSGDDAYMYRRVPEPGTVALMSLGLVGLGLWRRRQTAA